MTTTTLPSREAMYRALVERDESYQGVFVAGITTTGIFCRPGCCARSPKPENVVYFASPADAVKAGYRACLRCRPLDHCVTRPAWVDRLGEAVEREPTRRFTDGDLRAMGVDPVRVRRYFKGRHGMTFHAWHRARRMGLAHHATSESGSLDAVAYTHGYDSPSGFRHTFASLFGEPPGRADRCRCLLARRLETPLGAMLAVSAGDGLCMLEFMGRDRIETAIAIVRRRLDAVIVPGDDEHLRAIDDELGRYFAGTLTAFTVPLAQPGSDFERTVWQALRIIPFGTTRSYADVARSIGRPQAHRAVASANGRNHLAIVVPCHRVTRSDGTLGGYGGGVWRKRRLLELEAAGQQRA